VSVEFSTIIPTCRRPAELAEAITSVLAQTDVTLEIFVVDDSLDGSAKEVAAAFRDRRLIYMRNPHPTGGVPSVVRNLAWPYTRGPFVHFLDDDDIVPRGHYAAVKASFSEHPEVGVVFGHIEPFGNGPEEQLRHERQYFADAARNASICQRFGPTWAFTGRMLFDRAMLVCSAGVVRRKCLVRIGGFDPEIRLMEDADFYTRMIREFGAHFINRVTLRYRIGSPSLMHSPNPDESQLRHQCAGRRRMQAKYRKERGAPEFYALAAFTRTVLKIA
jgi:glycosyltransferase involved in cell wall biosynthesis